MDFNNLKIYQNEELELSDLRVILVSDLLANGIDYPIYKKEIDNTLKEIKWIKTIYKSKDIYKGFLKYVKKRREPKDIVFACIQLMTFAAYGIAPFIPLFVHFETELEMF